jgi:hypothetical protein
MNVTLYDCPFEHTQSNQPGKCVECEAKLVAVEYTPVRKNLHPSEMIYVDDENYVCFKDKRNFKGPGLWWTLRYSAWEVYADHPLCYQKGSALLIIGGTTFPSDDDLAEAAGRYEEWYEINKEKL